MTTTTLLWVNDAELHRQALARAGLADRLDIHAVKMEDEPPADLLARTEILLGWFPPPGLFARMPKLRWVQSLTAGVEDWLTPELPAHVALTSARGTHRVQMPENILGALFHLTKSYALHASHQREQRWERRPSTTLAGQTLGILGLGAIGGELAKKAAALEMRVIGTRRRVEALPGVERIHAPDATDEVLGQADYVVVLLPLTRDTENFMNAARFKAMRPGAYLINFGRGGLIVDEDLIAAVRAKTIAGAVLDVFREEPLPASHPFWTTAGIQVLPHIGGMHPGRPAMVATLFADNARCLLAGEPLRNLVERERGY
ncbi:MAG: D-2-hydroxyacid dehydrogenase [Betaproteobacteria bacterium]|nr:D-2-hydroxyacid dehydrogenase [Betaproteobacteria bacterium]